MARITIKDLPQSDELDRLSMVSIAGGARDGVRPVDGTAAMRRADRIVDYPPGLRTPPAAASKRATTSI